jgi:hypothetical protein
VKTMNFEWRSDPRCADPVAREDMHHQRTVTGEAPTTVLGETR